ncbi:MAG: hypothetical protein BWY45_03376 [Euryarchaeota archaeon ADurb.Bin294]|nr:MAG: hypothetical protein BWY45_03376 [Euryarchaeota archaeon ADurb.Bin294]
MDLIADDIERLFKLVPFSISLNSILKPGGKIVRCIPGADPHGLVERVLY